MGRGEEETGDWLSAAFPEAGAAEEHVDSQVLQAQGLRGVS